MGTKPTLTQIWDASTKESRSGRRGSIAEFTRRSLEVGFSPKEIKMKGELLEFRDFLKRNKIYLLVHFVIAIVTAAVIAQVSIINIGMLRPYYNDYTIYYTVSRNLFTNPSLIYDYNALSDLNVLPYRYFIFELVILHPLTFMPLVPSYITFCIIGVICNILTTYQIYRAFETKEKWLVLCLLFPFHVSSFASGQITSIVALCIAMSIYNFKEKNEARACLWLGLSMMFKPVTMFAILFVVIKSLKDFKKLVKQLFFVILPLLPDAFVFFFSPSLLSGFLEVNFGLFGGNRLRPSVSFSTIFSFFGFSSNMALIITAAVFIPVLAYLIKNKPIEMTIPAGLLAFFLIQGDVWSSQFVFFIPFILLAFKRKKDYKIVLLYAIFADMILLFFYINKNTTFITPILTLLLAIFYIRRNTTSSAEIQTTHHRNGNV